MNTWKHPVKWKWGFNGSIHEKKKKKLNQNLKRFFSLNNSTTIYACSVWIQFFYKQLANIGINIKTQFIFEEKHLNQTQEETRVTH